MQYYEATSCGSKIAHRNKRSAKGHLIRMKTVQSVRGNVMEYKCPFCGWWHVGHKPIRRAQ